MYITYIMHLRNNFGDGAGGLAYEWKDPGICAVCNFEDALDALDSDVKTV